MFMEFIATDELKPGTLENGGPILQGRTWILLNRESRKVKVLFVAIPEAPSPPAPETVFQVIQYPRRPPFRGEGFVGLDRSEGHWYHLIPTPAMDPGRHLRP
jgi:hypothetical protein